MFSMILAVISDTRSVIATHCVAFTSVFTGQLISLGSRKFGRVDPVAGEDAVHSSPEYDDEIRPCMNC